MDLQGFITKYNPQVTNYSPLYFFLVDSGDNTNKFYCYWKDDNLRIEFKGTIIYNKLCTVDKIDTAIDFVKQYYQNYLLL